MELRHELQGRVPRGAPRRLDPSQRDGGVVPMRSVVVGTDGSPSGQDAVRWAADLAWAQGAELTVMTALVPVESELPPHVAERLLDRAAEQLTTWSEPARRPGLDVRNVVERGDPRQAILAVADRADADVVIVGRVGSSSGPGVLHLSSVPEYLAHHCDRPLAVIGGDVNSGINRVVVGADGSENGLAAARWVAGAASGTSAHIVVAFVQHPADGPHGDSSPEREELRQRTLEGPTRVLEEAGVEAESRALISTSPAEGLLGEARRERADLVVVGMRGLGGFLGLRVGRVALRTLHEADVPVVLVPPDTAHR